MSPLDKKLLRDVKRLWAHALAISLVMAAGMATVLLAVGSYRSLEETRIAYYERQLFAHVFATVERTTPPCGTDRRDTKGGYGRDQNSEIRSSGHRRNGRTGHWAIHRRA